MSSRLRGFSLVELLLALAIGLVLVAGGSQVVISSRATQASQQAAMWLQDDARFVLGKMIQEIRQAGMFGCLGTAFIENAPAAFDQPVRWSAGNGSASLTLVTADVGSNGGTPTWTVVSDCRTGATAYSESRTPGPGQLAFPIRRIAYGLRKDQLTIAVGNGAPLRQPLVDNVKAFNVSFGIASSATDIAASSYSSNPSDPARIRSVRLSLTLFDPHHRVSDQTFNVVAALRNRLP